jgi:hypothetical protein
MSSKRIEISLKSHALLKRSLAFSKRASQQLPHCHNGQSAPEWGNLKQETVKRGNVKQRNSKRGNVIRRNVKRANVT